MCEKVDRMVGDQIRDRELIRARCGENKQIADGNYDDPLAVKCVNGTFVGRRERTYPLTKYFIYEGKGE